MKQADFNQLPLKKAFGLALANFKAGKITYDQYEEMMRKWYKANFKTAEATTVYAMAEEIFG